MPDYENALEKVAIHICMQKAKQLKRDTERATQCLEVMPDQTLWDLDLSTDYYGWILKNHAYLWKQECDRRFLLRPAINPGDGLLRPAAFAPSDDLKLLRPTQKGE